MLSLERAKELVSYDSKTGVFTRNGTGGVAGTMDKKGRIFICLDYKIIRAHRLAWFMTHGVWPVGDIDHKDGNPGNNAILNLRDVDRSVNMQNQRRARSDNKTGLLGVVIRPNGRYRALLSVRGKKYSLGAYASADEAHQAYLIAKRKLHEGCTL